MSRLVIVGAGGHGRVVADAAECMGRWAQICFVDDRYPAQREVGPWSVLGTARAAATFATADDELVVAIGTCAVRLALQDELESRGARIATVVHPRAVISRYAQLASGGVVCAAAVINAGARIGRAVIINTAATIDHDCQLEAGVHVSPGAHLAGEVKVGARSWIGIGAAVREGVSIGSDVVVGAGAAVVADVPSDEVVFGVPARARP